MFPVMLDLVGRQVVVVGFGPVGQRKAAAAAAGGASMRVVDPGPAALPGGTAWEHIREPYRPAHLAGACLAFACATPEVNTRVVADARARGLWVNSASDPRAGDFVLPSVIRTGGLISAVSTGGASPALARRVREKLEAEFDASFAAWVKLLAEIRTEVLATVQDPARRRQLLDGFADWPWLARVRGEGVEAVQAAMREEIRTSR